MSLKVAVVWGGPSEEAAVSRVSAQAVVEALEEARHEVERYELGPRLASSLDAARPQVVFPVTHGRLGEDGCLQGLLEVLGLPYVGSGVLASSLAASKPAAKQAFRGRGLPVAEDRAFSRGSASTEELEQARRIVGPAVVVKPAAGGSAIGVTRVQATATLGEYLAAIEAAFEVDELVVVERWLRGEDLTCGVLELTPGEPRPLPPTLIEPLACDWYDFKSKYGTGGSRHSCPAPLKPALLAEVQRCAVEAHRAVGARDLSRIDFIVDRASDSLSLLEVNTLPGMTAVSLYPEAAAMGGVPFRELCDLLARNAAARGTRHAVAAVPMPT